LKYAGVQQPTVKHGNLKAVQEVYSKLGIKGVSVSDSASGEDADTSERKGTLAKGKALTVPSVTGMDLSDALYVLGNAGYRVAVRGSGLVKRQSVTGGSIIPRGSKITIELE
jgi:cell division protein FtsI (penicillin-binding protein 3)